jgi:hypothetical protein
VRQAAEACEIAPAEAFRLAARRQAQEGNTQFAMERRAQEVVDAKHRKRGAANVSLKRSMDSLQCELD